MVMVKPGNPRFSIRAQGPVVAAFEAEVAALVGRKYGVATSSGTAALHLVLQALDVAGRQVLVPSYVCSSLVHATHAAGAIPTPVDVDGVTGNIDTIRSIWGTSSLPPSCHTCSGGRRRRRQNCRSGCPSSRIWP